MGKFYELIASRSGKEDESFGVLWDLEDDVAALIEEVYHQDESNGWSVLHMSASFESLPSFYWEFMQQSLETIEMAMLSGEVSFCRPAEQAKRARRSNTRRGNH